MDSMIEEAMEPSFYHAFIELPLYTPVEITNREFMQSLRTNKVQFDAFCVHCKKEATFRTLGSVGGGAGKAHDANWFMKPARFKVDLYC